MLGQPSLVARHHRGDAQGVAFLAQQGIAAVARSIGPDFAGFRIVDDPLVLVARPGHIGLTFGQRCTKGMDSWNEHTVGAQLVKSALAHAGHDTHRQGHIAAVGDFNTQSRNVRTQRSHAERHHIHGAALHRACKQTFHPVSHLDRIGPVVGRAGIGLIFGANKGPALDARHILGIGGGIIASRTLGLVQCLQRALGNQIGDDLLLFFFGTVAPVNTVRLGQSCDLRHPGHEALMLCRCRKKAGG